jgi:hypothetical protein
LCKMRPTVDMLIRNCSSGFHTDRWCFVSATSNDYEHHFGRLTDHHMSTDTDCCLLDIAVHTTAHEVNSSSADEDDTVFILDENQVATFRNSCTSVKSASPPAIVVTAEDPVAKRANLKLTISKSTDFDNTQSGGTSGAALASTTSSSMSGSVAPSGATHSSSHSSVNRLLI